MKVLIIFAHPEQQSLNGALLRVAVEELKAQGNEVQVSDLYAMNWKAAVNRDDFPNLADDVPLQVAAASGSAFKSHSLTQDVVLEQEKLAWADTVIFQFPLWWFTMPAILKGWIERVLVYKYAYGVGEHTNTHWGDRYGEGVFAGKRAMLIVTVGGWSDHYSIRGVNGPIDDVLFPINHGVLYYPGFDVLPPFIVYQSDRMKEENFDTIASQLRTRMREIKSIKPIPYRRQNGGDYKIPSMQLKEEFGENPSSAFSLHIKTEKETSLHSAAGNL